jgi:hypothetical protein
MPVFYGTAVKAGKATASRWMPPLFCSDRVTGKGPMGVRTGMA